MLLLSTDSFTVDGVTVFPDHLDPNQFWYLPGPVSLAMQPGGTEPQFLLIEYAPDVAATGVSGVGFLQVTLCLKLDPDTQAKALAQISGIFPNADSPHLAPVGFDAGTVQIVALDLQGSGGATDTAPPGAVTMVQNILGAVTPDLFGENDAVFAVRLTDAGATVLKAAFEDGMAPVGGIYNLTFTGVRPALDVKITADLKRVYDSFSVGLSAKVYWVGAGIDATFEKLKQDGAITIQVVNLASDAANADAEKQALDLFKQDILAQWFTPSLSPTTAAAADVSGHGAPPSSTTTTTTTSSNTSSGTSHATGTTTTAGGMSESGSTGGTMGGTSTVSGGSGGQSGGMGGGATPHATGGIMRGLSRDISDSGSDGGSSSGSGGYGSSSSTGTSSTGGGYSASGSGSATGSANYGTSNANGASSTGAGAGASSNTGSSTASANTQGATANAAGNATSTGATGGTGAASGAPQPNGAGASTSAGSGAGHPTGGGGSSGGASGSHGSGSQTSTTTTTGPAGSGTAGAIAQGVGALANAASSAASSAAPFGVTLQLKFVHQEEQKVVTYEYNRMDAVQRIHAPQGYFGLLLNGLDKSKHFLQVDGTDPFFNKFAVVLTPTGNFAAIGLQTAHVALDYGDPGSPDVKHGEFVFDASNMTQTTWSVFQGQISRTDYNYTATYTFDPNSGWVGATNTYAQPTVNTDNRQLTLDPHDFLGFLAITVLPGVIDANTVDRVEVDLSYTDSDGWNATNQIIVRPGAAAQVWKLRLSHKDECAYTYTTRCVLKDGTTFTSDVQTSSANTVFANDAFHGGIDVTIQPALDPTKTKSAVVQIAYADATNSYNFSTTQLFQPVVGTTLPPVRVHIPIVDPGNRQFTYTVTVISTADKQTTGTPVTTASGLIVVSDAVS
jgi:hypothetical protein